MKLLSFFKKRELKVSKPKVIEPIAGQIYKYWPEIEDPFPPKDTYTVTILETKKGWVRYIETKQRWVRYKWNNNSIWKDESMRISTFVQIYKLEESK